jgi:hypothetical protein
MYGPGSRQEPATFGEEMRKPTTIGCARDGSIQGRSAQSPGHPIGTARRVIERDHSTSRGSFLLEETRRTERLGQVARGLLYLELRRFGAVVQGVLK